MKEKITREDMLFFGTYILYLTVDLIKHTQFWRMIPIPSMLEMLKIGAALILCLKIISDKEYTGRQVIIFCSIAVIVIISCICSRNLGLFYFVCFVFGIKGISYLKVLRATFIIHMLAIAAVAVGVWTGIIPNQMVGSIVWSSTMISEESIGRYNLGFGHPNTASAIVFFTTMVYMCMRKTCSFPELIISLGINFMVYQKTGSRTCFLITLMFLPLMYWFANKKTFQRYWQVLFTIAPIIIILMATFAQVFYNSDNKILAKINSMLSNRMMLGHQGLLNYGIPLFGQDILWIGDSNNEYGLPYNFVDSAYMRILLENGIIVYIILFIVIVMTMHYLAKARNGKLCIAFLALLVHSMVEMSIYDISWAPFCLLMGQMAVLDNNKE